jgi:hypothetical protein
MVVRLRLQRFGMRRRPVYRIVAADARAPRDGKFLERVSTAVIVFLFINNFVELSSVCIIPFLEMA